MQTEPETNCTDVCKLALFQGYNGAFRRALLRCSDVPKQEALHRYIDGLRPDPKAWVRMKDINDLNEAMRIAERFDAAFAASKRSAGASAEPSGSAQQPAAAHAGRSR